jgi:hypothetical protein
MERRECDLFRGTNRYQNTLIQEDQWKVRIRLIQKDCRADHSSLPEPRFRQQSGTGIGLTGRYFPAVGGRIKTSQ